MMYMLFNLYKVGGAMRKKIVILISVSIVAVVFLYMFLICNEDKMDQKVDLEYNESFADSNIDVVNYFSKYNDNNDINMYEYTDKMSLMATLIYYYFEFDKSNQYFTNVEKEMLDKLNEYSLDNKEFDSELIENVDLIYLYSNIVEKYNLNNKEIFSALNKVVTNINDSIDKIDEKSTELYVLKWKLYISMIKIHREFSDFDTWEGHQNEIVCSDKASEYTKNLVKDLFMSVRNNQKINSQKMINEYNKLYNRKLIDIEMYSIYICMLSEVCDIQNTDVYYEEIKNYYSKYFYQLPSMSSFYAFKVIEINKQYDDIKDVYEVMPKDEQGMVPAIAVIVPNYKRLYAYLQICKYCGIEVNSESIKSWIGKININNVTAEDFYFSCIISDMYPELDINLKPYIEKSAAKVSSIDITESNCYMVYNLIKTMNYMDIDGTDIYDKYKKYMSDKKVKSYTIEKMWEMELDYLYNGIVPDVSGIEFSSLIEYKDIKFDAYYTYLSLSLISNYRNEEVFNNITTDIITHRTEGGYFSNETFKYVDIYRTYQMLYILEKCKRSN